VFIESAELRNVRQAMARWRALQLAQMPGDVPMLEHLQRVGLELLRDVWSDESCPVDKAAAAAEWLTSSILISPEQWLAPGLIDAREALARHLMALSAPLTDLFGARQAAYSRWVEYYSQRHALPGRQDTLSMVAERFRKMADEWEEDELD
jgi:hypothetical protein